MTEQELEELKAEMEAMGFHTLTAEEEAALDLPEIPKDLALQYRMVQDGPLTRFVEAWVTGDDELWGWTPVDPSDFDDYEDFSYFYGVAYRKPILQVPDHD